VVGERLNERAAESQDSGKRKLETGTRTGKKMETGKWKLETGTWTGREWKLPEAATSQFPISNFQFLVSSF
jgi:hypothetical protein